MKSIAEYFIKNRGMKHIEKLYKNCMDIEQSTGKFQDCLSAYHNNEELIREIATRLENAPVDTKDIDNGSFTDIDDIDGPSGFVDISHGGSSFNGYYVPGRYFQICGTLAEDIDE